MERVHLEDPRLDGSITLRWIFRQWYVGAWAVSSWLRKGTGGGYECDNVPSSSIQCGEILD